MVRLRALPVRHLVLLGAVLGLFVASAVTVASTQRYEASSIYLLGSGSGLSALIASEAARILIVNGDDPAALATAFADARPDMLRRIDLVILVPGASEQLVDRAVEMADPRRLYALPNDRFHPGNAVHGLTIRPMDGASSIDGTGGLSVSIEPASASGWAITVSLGETHVLLSDQVPFRPSADAVIVMGTHDGDQAGALNVPVIAAKTALPDDFLIGQGGALVSVKRDATLRIRLQHQRLVIDSCPLT